MPVRPITRAALRDELAGRRAHSAYARHAAEVDPVSFSDVVVRSGHPVRPALVAAAR